MFRVKAKVIVIVLALIGAFTLLPFVWKCTVSNNKCSRADHRKISFQMIMEDTNCTSFPVFSEVQSSRYASSFDIKRLQAALKDLKDGSSELETHIISPFVAPKLLSTEDLEKRGVNDHVLLSAYQVKWHDASKDVARCLKKVFHKPIPNIVHFVFVSSSKKSLNFTLMAYLSIRATFLRIKPDAIYLHCYREPAPSPYYLLSKPMITKIIIHKPLTHVFNRPVKVIEHVTDVIRMQVLLKYGGIYIDSDIIPLRSFDIFLYNSKPMTLGKETSDGTPNALMIGQRNNSFLRHWYNKYKTFNDGRWNQHSVKLPYKLARDHLDEINIQNIHTFFYPRWFEFTELFSKRSMRTVLKDNYAVHLWHHLNKEYLDPLTPSLIFACDIGVNEVFRPLIPNPFVTFVIKVTSKSDLSLNFLNTITAIAKQSFPLWEVIVDISDLNFSEFVSNTKTLSYISAPLNQLSMRYSIPYYSCNLSALLLHQNDVHVPEKLTHNLGSKIKGSVFSRLRCGDFSSKQIISLPQPSYVHFDNETGTEKNVVPEMKTIDTTSHVRSRGVWLINIEIGEIIPVKFLDQVLAVIKNQSTGEDFTITIHDAVKEKYFIKQIHFVFGKE